MSLRNEDGTCGCGSGHTPNWEYDGYGIPLFLACDKCWDENRKKFRHDVFGRYEADEPIDPEDYEGPIYNEDY
jgi:hypothetical protein